MKSAREKGSLHASSFASFHAIGCILKDQAGGGLSRGVKLLGSMQEDVGCWLAMLDHVACTNTTADYACGCHNRVLWASSNVLIWQLSAVPDFFHGCTFLGGCDNLQPSVLQTVGQKLELSLAVGTT